MRNRLVIFERYNRVDNTYVYLGRLQDFEKYGVYDAQSALEEVHKQEEDELYKQMFQDRKRQVDKLERHLVEEKRRTVKELIDWFDKREASKEEKQLGIHKVDRCIN